MLSSKVGLRFAYGSRTHDSLLTQVCTPLLGIKKAKHIYSSLCQWDSLQTFVDFMLQSICYNKDGLVIINKPYGVSVRPSTKKQTVSDSYLLHTAVVGDMHYTLSDALPQIAEQLGYQSLSVIKSPGRYASGISVLSADESISKSVTKSMANGKATDKGIYNYWMVLIGHPQPESGSEIVGITLKEGQGKKESQVVLETIWSKKAVKRKEVFPAFVEYSTIQKGPLCSLVQFRISRTKWHFIRIYAAYLLSPILGDHLYGGRVQHILGIPVAISPYSDHAKLPQKLSKDLLAALELQSNEHLTIPAHIHFKSLLLKNYGDKSRDLTIEAPLPEYFLWSCNRLMLERGLKLAVSQHS